MPFETRDIAVIIHVDSVQSVQLFDIQGRLVLTRVSGVTNERIDLTWRVAGVYFIKVTTEKGTKVERIVKK